MKTIRLGVIGYGVRMDMLMDEFAELPVPPMIAAVADPNPARVKELMQKAVPKKNSTRWRLIRSTAFGENAV